MRCQSGLAEDPALNLQDGSRVTKKAVCSECAVLGGGEAGRRPAVGC
jgi:hypothetical protein